MDLLRRMFHSSWLIPVLSVMSVLALSAAVWSVWGVMAQDDRRERDRIQADLDVCNRVNILRGQMVDGFAASATALQRTLDVFFPEAPTGDPVRDARVRQVRSEIDPIIDDLEASVAQVEFTDCEAVTPGVRPRSTTPPTTEGP